MDPVILHQQEEGYFYRYGSFGESDMEVPCLTHKVGPFFIWSHPYVESYGSRSNFSWEITLTYLRCSENMFHQESILGTIFFVRWILCQAPLRNGLLMLDPLLVTAVEYIILVICLSETRVPHVSWLIVVFRVEIAILGCPHFWETQTAPEKSEMISRNGWDIILALISQHFTVSKWVFQLWSLHPIGVIEDDIPILHVILPIYPNFNATSNNPTLVIINHQGWTFHNGPIWSHLGNLGSMGENCYIFQGHSWIHRMEVSGIPATMVVSIPATTGDPSVPPRPPVVAAPGSSAEPRALGASDSAALRLIRSWPR